MKLSIEKNMASTQQQSLCFSTDEAKLALNDILDTLKNSENATKLEEAKGSAGNDMLKMMQIFFPVATQIQMNVIEKYGFPADGEGIIRFAQTIKHFEKHDDEIKELNTELRNIVMPQMAAPVPQVTS